VIRHFGLRMKICDDHSCLVLLLPILAFLSLDMGYIRCCSGYWLDGCCRQEWRLVMKSNKTT
jgi:hypothetical protein